MSADIERRVRALESQIAGLRSAGRPRYVFDTYTPTYRGLATAGTTTYNVQAGAYARINSIAFVWARVDWSNATGTGAGLITLPFKARTITNLGFAVNFYAEGLDFGGSYVVAFTSDATVSVSGVDVSYVRFVSLAATTGAATSMNVVAAANVTVTVIMPLEDTA